MSTQDPVLVRVRPSSRRKEVFSNIDNNARRRNRAENQEELALEDSSSPATPAAPIVTPIVPPRGWWVRTRTVIFRLLLLCGIGLLVLGAWWATAFPKLSKADIDRLVELPYFAHQSRRRLSYLAENNAACATDADAAAPCMAALGRLCLKSSRFTLDWHNHTWDMIDALDQTSFSHAHVIVETVRSSLGEIEASTSAALTACDSFFDTLDAENCDVPIANYRMSKARMEVARDIIPSVRDLWGLPGAAWFLDLRVRWSALEGWWAIDTPFQVGWRVRGLRTALSTQAVVIQTLLQGHQTAYGGQLEESIEQFQREIEGQHGNRRKTWPHGMFSWV